MKRKACDLSPITISRESAINVIRGDVKQWMRKHNKDYYAPANLGNC